MRLRAKVSLIFGAGLGLMAALAALVFPRVADKVSETQLHSLSRTLGAYLVHDLESLPYGGDEPAFEKAIDSRLEFVQDLGESSGNYRVRSAIVIGPDFKVEVGHPDSELGADYSGHQDVREAMAAAVSAPSGAGAPPVRIVLEAASVAGGPATDADIVAPLALADGDRRVLEVKLDFTGTLAMLGAQYARLRLAVGALIALGVALIGGIILAGIRGAVLRPVLAISAAMEKVGSGDLDASAGVSSSDEIGAMARRFDEMTAGLRERFQLERYVSRSTVDAARGRAERGGGDAPVRRKRMAVFFSDVRGFTAYSESRDPARVVAVLNELLGMQAAIVAKAGGEVDKFVGDETMAVFASPDRAIAAALVIRAKVGRMAAEIDGLELGFGIHVGELVEGDIGSPDRMDHTVIGDTVNTAARLEAAAKAGQVLVSAAAARDPAVAARFALSPLPPLSAKGKAEPLEVFAVEGERGDGPKGS